MRVLITRPEIRAERHGGEAARAAATSRCCCRSSSRCTIVEAARGASRRRIRPSRSPAPKRSASLSTLGPSARAASRHHALCRRRRRRRGRPARPASGYRSLAPAAGWNSRIWSDYLHDGRPPTCRCSISPATSALGRFEASACRELGYPLRCRDATAWRQSSYTIEDQQAMLVATDGRMPFFFYSRETAKHFFRAAISAVDASQSAAQDAFFASARNIAEAVPEELQNSSGGRSDAR